MSGESSTTCPCCKALWVKFRLVEDLARDDKKAKAKVFEKGGVRHFWQGEDPDPNPASEGFNVYNLEDKFVTGGDPQGYRFEGVEDDVGLACLDESDPAKDRYRIVSMSHEPKLGKLDESLSYGGSATCSIWTGEAGSEADSDRDETVHCWLLKAGESIAAGTRVVISHINGHWEVTAAACL